MKLFFLLIIGSSLWSNIFAGTFTSSIDGNWTTGATWGGSEPDHNQTNGSDVIFVETNVVLNDDFKLKGGTNMTIRSGDTLTINGNVIFSNGSFFTVETGGVLIVNGNVQNKNNSDDIVINGDFNISGDFDGGNGSAITGSGVVTTVGETVLSGSATIFTIGAGCTDNCTYPPSSLPVELVNFTGEIKNGKTFFSWTTLSEVNNNHFILEKLNVDNKTWEKIEQIKGAGYSASTIDYKISVEKQDGYFRLKQVDYDGVFDYSKTIFLTPEETKTDYTIYPNPAKNVININIIENNSMVSNVVITNSVGQKVSTFELKNKENLDLDISDLVKGVYYVTISTIKEGKTYKLIKE